MTSSGAATRLFVVARRVEALRDEYAIFSDLAEATERYEDAAFVVRNAPGEGATDDPTIVTGAALFAADTTDPDLAKAMAMDGRAFTLESEGWPSED